MIWHSVPLMTGIDILVVTLAATAIFWLRRSPGRGLHDGSRVIVAGLCLMGAFYLTDLVIMWLLPAAAPSTNAMLTMAFLHMNVAWLLFPVAGILVFVGFVLVSRQRGAQLEIVQEHSHALAVSEERYQAVVEIQTEFIVRWLPDGTRTFVNEAYAAYFEEPKEKILGTSFFPLITEEDREQVLARIKHLTPNAAASTGQHRVVRPDGTVAWQEWTDRGIFDDAGKLVELQSVGRDITELRRTREALEESEALFRSAVENSTDRLFILDSDATIVYLSPAFTRELGYSAKELTGKSLFDVLHPDDAPLVRAEIAKIFADHDYMGYVRDRWRHANGSWRYADSSGKAWSLGGRTLCVVNSHDVTERVHLEQEVFDVSRRERERLGRDLHDGIGQQLTGLALLAKALERKLETGIVPKVAEIRELESIASQTLNQTRYLARGLFPIGIGEGGLHEAFGELAQSAAMLSELSVEVSIDENVVIDNDESAMHMYLIAREAITNAARHGQADRVTVGVQDTEDAVRLFVQDDGIGIPGEAELREGVGLRSMRHRARELDAEFEVRSMPSGGTLVQCWIPHSKLASGRTQPQPTPDR